MKLSGVFIFWEYTKKTLQPNSLYRAARFANFEGVLGFSVPLADLLGNTCLLVIGAFSSTFFVSMFQGSYRSVFFEDFSDLFYSCISQEKSNVCLLPSTKIPLIITISFAIRFVFAGQAGRGRWIVICINPTHTQMIDGTEKPIRSLQTRSAIHWIRLYVKSRTRSRSRPQI